MLKGGWIKLHRQIKESDLFRLDGDHMKMAIWLITSVVYDFTEMKVFGRVVKVAPGQVLVTAGQLIRAFDGSLTRQNVRTILKNLEKIDFIKCETLQIGRCRAGYLITVINFNRYQI